MWWALRVLGWVLLIPGQRRLISPFWIKNQLAQVSQGWQSGCWSKIWSSGPWRRVIPAAIVHLGLSAKMQAKNASHRCNERPSALISPCLPGPLPFSGSMAAAMRALAQRTVASRVCRQMSPACFSHCRQHLPSNIGIFLGITKQTLLASCCRLLCAPTRPSAGPWHLRSALRPLQLPPPQRSPPTPTRPR
jgi:hypothetical protein